MCPQWIFLGVLGGYIPLSLLFLLYPTLLHKKKKQQFHARYISHRGGGGERLENTMSAFKNAFENNTDMFEIDVQLTKDGQVVISHDDNLYRVTGRNVNISNCDFNDIPPLKTTLSVNFTAGSMVTSSEGDNKIALLRAVLETFPDTPLNIDTKHNDNVIQPTIDLVNEFNRKHNIVMANMRSEAINKIHKMDPDLLLGASIKRSLLILILFYTGLLPFIPLKESFFQIPLPQVLHLNQDFPIKKWKVQVAQCLLMRPLLFRHLQKRGIQIHMFVVNDIEHFYTCFNKYQVDGVMTDFPHKLAQYVDNNKKRK